MTTASKREVSQAAVRPPLRLYQFAASGNSRIVRLVLAEKNLGFERVNVDVASGENLEPAFLKLNPRGKVPVLVHASSGGEVVIPESTVINEYLEEVFPEPRLMPPTAAGRARVRLLTHLFDTELSPAAGPLIIECLLKPPAAQRAELIANHQAVTRGLLARLAEMMGPGPYLAGEYSLADASFTPALGVMGACGIELRTEFPALAAWLAAVERRPSFPASAR